MSRSFPLAAALVSAASALAAPPPGASGRSRLEGTPAPLPALTSPRGMRLDDALAARRSVRDYAARSLSPDEIGRLLWAAQGVTEPSTGGRTAPSAGALFPIEVYVVAADGVSRYQPTSHALARVAAGDLRASLARAAFDQAAVRQAPVSLVLAGVAARTARKYGDRADRYVLLEAGHVAQNVLLEAVALGLGAVPVGAFDDEAVARVVGLPRGERPLYILPVGALAP